MKQIPSPNFWKGHQKRIAVVLHVSVGTIESIDSWFSTSQSQVSAHYGISKTGEVHQYVSEKNSAWAVGVVKKPSWKLIKNTNPNWYTISIEHEGYQTTIWTEAMKKASTELVRGICERNNIPITRDNIIGHYEIDIEKPFIESKVDDIFKRVEKTSKIIKKLKTTEKSLIGILIEVVKRLKAKLAQKVALLLKKLKYYE